MENDFVAQFQVAQKALAHRYAELIRHFLAEADLPELRALRWATPSNSPLVAEIRCLADRLASVGRGDFAMDLQEEAACVWVEEADLAGLLAPYPDEQLLIGWNDRDSDFCSVYEEHTT